MINFLGCMVLPPEVTKNFQVRKIQRYDKSDTDISDLIIECFSQDKSHQCHKFDDFLDLTQCFQIWLDSVLIEMNDVNNVIYNIFK